MRAKEFLSNSCLNENSNWYIGEDGRTYYHGTKVDFDDFDLDIGSISIDRAIGPHFSATPALANKFAISNPAGIGRGPKFGGRVILVEIPGEIYTVPQQPTDIDTFAIARDVIRVVFPAKPDLKKKIYDFIFNKITEIPGIDHKKYFDIVVNSEELVQSIAHFPNEQILRELARTYRDILKSQGYGVIKYTNTGTRERKGLRGEDLESFIALVPPRPKFSRE